MKTILTKANQNHKCIHTNLVSILTSDLLNPSKIVLLAMFSSPQLLYRKAIMSQCGITIHQWRIASAELREAGFLSSQSHAGNILYFNPQGVSFEGHAHLKQLQSILFAKGTSLLARIAATYLHCRNSLSNWKVNKQDILNQLGITRATWKSKVVPFLKGKLLRYSTHKRKTKLILSLPLDNAIKTHDGLSTGGVGRNQAPLQYKKTILNPTTPFQVKSSLSDAYLRVKECLKIGKALTLADSFIFMLRKRYHWDVIHDKLCLLARFYARGSIKTVKGWLLGALKSEGKPRGFKAMDEVVKVDKGVTNRAPGVEETHIMLEQLYAKPVYNDLDEELMVTNLALEARLALRARFARRGQEKVMQRVVNY